MSHHQLNQEQRYEISAYLQLGKSYSYIANAIGVHTSTISREVKRNSDEQGHYYGGLADKRWIPEAIAKLRKELRYDLDR